MSGSVKDNPLILEAGVHLADGVRLVLTIRQESSIVSSEELVTRRLIFARMSQFGRTLEGRNVDLTRDLLSEREELRGRG